MIPSIRKKHKFIWVLLGVILPMLFVFGYKAIPEKVNYEGDVYLNSTKGIGEIVDAKDLEFVKINLREAKNHQKQIEVVIKKPLVSPSNHLVVKGFNFGEFYVEEVLGSTGIYRWNWSDSVELAYQVQLIDKINNIELEKINLKLGEDLNEHKH